MTPLRELLYEAHRQACLRDNASTQVLIAAYEMNGHQLIPAITAAIATIGGKHAPIKKTLDITINSYMDGPEWGQDLFDVIYGLNDEIIYGFGSSFFKGIEDPILEDIKKYLERNHAGYWNIIWEIRGRLKKVNKNLYPNLAFYTACVAHIEKVPYDFCESLVIEPRIPQWIEILKEKYGVS